MGFGVVVTSEFARVSWSRMCRPDDEFWVIEVLFCSDNFEIFANSKRLRTPGILTSRLRKMPTKTGMSREGSWRRGEGRGARGRNAPLLQEIPAEAICSWSLVGQGIQRNSTPGRRTKKDESGSRYLRGSCNQVFRTVERYGLFAK